MNFPKCRGVFKLFSLLTCLYAAYFLSYLILTKFTLASKNLLKNVSDTFGVSFYITESLPDFNEIVTVPSKVQIENKLPWCGLPKPCPNDNSFSVHIYTGQDHKDQPKLCIDGKYVLSKNANGGGRGINVAVIDSLTKSVVQVSHFDTYEKESTGLETLLLTLRPGDIIILLTFDEPTRKLTRVTRLLLHELGSAMIQNLFYRGSWYMVSQKGIDGFSPFEELHYGEGGGWSQVHDVRLCVPFKIQGQLIHPDPLPRINPARSHFCQGHPDFPHFCDANVVNDPLIAAPPLKSSPTMTRLYNTPILVLTGSSITYLPLTLETIIRQPGVNPSLVVVFYQNDARTITKLANLFSFMSEELSSPSNNTCALIAEMFETGYLLFPDAKELILVSQNVILSPDFLLFFSQLLPLLDSDQSIQSISAWNENGFRNTSGDPSLIYRVDTFSGVATLFKRGFFQRSWCSSWSNGDVYLLNLTFPYASSIAPDLSRATIVSPSFNSSSMSATFWKALDLTFRISHLELTSQIVDISSLHKDEYPKHLNRLIQKAKKIHLDPKYIGNCKHNLNSPSRLLKEAGLNNTIQVVVIFYPQKNPEDLQALTSLCQCWGLFHHPDIKPRPLFNRSILRFTWQKRPVILAGNKSVLLAEVA